MVEHMQALADRAREMIERSDLKSRPEDIDPLPQWWEVGDDPDMRCSTDRKR